MNLILEVLAHFPSEGHIIAPHIAMRSIMDRFVTEYRPSTPVSGRDLLSGQYGRGQNDRLCSPQKLQETIHISGGVVTKYT
jgi:hypothetical protein